MEKQKFMEKQRFYYDKKFLGGKAGDQLGYYLSIYFH